MPRKSKEAELLSSFFRSIDKTNIKGIGHDTNLDELVCSKVTNLAGKHTGNITKAEAAAIIEEIGDPNGVATQAIFRNIEGILYDDTVDQLIDEGIVVTTDIGGDSTEITQSGIIGEAVDPESGEIVPITSEGQHLFRSIDAVIDTSQRNILIGLHIIVKTKLYLQSGEFTTAKGYFESKGMSRSTGYHMALIGEKIAPPDLNERLENVRALGHLNDQTLAWGNHDPLLIGTTKISHIIKYASEEVENLIQNGEVALPSGELLDIDEIKSTPERELKQILRRNQHLEKQVGKESELKAKLSLAEHERDAAKMRNVQLEEERLELIRQASDYAENSAVTRVMREKFTYITEMMGKFNPREANEHQKIEFVTLIKQMRETLNANVNHQCGDLLVEIGEALF